MEKLPKVTRHKSDDGTVFQVHHFEGVNPEIDTVAEVGRVFRELPDGRVLFSGGCAKRILLLPDPDAKPAAEAPCAEAACAVVEAPKAKAKAGKE